MARRSYVASGKADPGALPVIAAATLGTGAAAGLALGFVSQWLSLLLIFPAALGAIIGGAGLTVIKSRRVRQPLAVALLGLAAGLLGETSLHLMKYLNFRAAIGERITADPSSAAWVSEHGLGAAIDSVLGGEARVPPLLGYLQLAAANGVTISKAGHGSSSSSPTLTGTGVHALWLINLLIVCGIAIAMLVSQAREPFCEGCLAWYDQTRHLGSGAGDASTVKEAVLRLESSQYAEAARNLGISDGKSASLLRLLGCSKCNAHEPLLELTLITGLRGNKPKNKQLFVSLISPSEAAQLREAVKVASA